VGSLPSWSANPADWHSNGEPPSEQWPPPAGEKPVAWLSIPALGLAQVPIFDRGLDSGRHMQIAGGYAVSRYDRSAPFGSHSNTVLYGHDDIEGGVFGRLSSLRPGSQITLQLPGGATLAYQVSRAPTIVPPQYVSILAPSTSPQLTLFTCYPLWQDDHRVFLTAVPVSS
jgi:LPXTG-site transpeptidase (sortase) family protein